MPSETTICNLALGKLGEGNIIALDEESPEARVCRLHYEETRDEVLRSHRWNFAIKREHLVRNVTPPVFGWNFRYELPTDCLRVLDVCGWDVTKRPGHWEVEGRFVVSNDEDADARYIWRVVDCNLFDALFVEALVLKLAGKIARPINGSAKMSFFFIDTATTEIYTLSLHDAL